MSDRDEGRPTMRLRGDDAGGSGERPSEPEHGRSTTRRRLLATGAAGLTAGLAGCSLTEEAGSSGDREVGTPGDREVRLDVTVLDPDGDPVTDEPVVLLDTGGTTDAQVARTDGDGLAPFVEGVGPPPCNTHFVGLPDRRFRRDVGCFEGGTTESVEVRLDEESMAGPREPGAPRENGRSGSR